MKYSPYPALLMTLRAASSTWQPITCSPCAMLLSAKAMAASRDLEDLALPRRYLVAGSGKGHPGIIGDHGVRIGQMRPEVEKDQVATPDGTMLRGGRFVMGIAGVGIDRDMRRTLRRNQPGLAYKFREAL